MVHNSLFEFFGSICHQDPGRSASLAGQGLFLCSRCAGIFIAYLATIAGVALGRDRLPSRFGASIGIPLLLSVLVMLASVKGLIPDTSSYRIAVGAFFGASLGLTNGILFASAYRQVAPRTRADGRGSIVQPQTLRLLLAFQCACVVVAGVVFYPFVVVSFCLVVGVGACFFVNSALLVAAVVPTSKPRVQRARLMVAIPVGIATFEIIGRLPV